MPEVKVGQKYQIVGNWHRPDNEVVTVTKVHEDTIDTVPSVYASEGFDFKRLFFPNVDSFRSSAEYLGFVLIEDVAEEVRSVSATGGEKGVKLAQFSLLPMEALKEVAEHYGVGAQKYEKHNMRRGYEWSKSFDALMRHATQFWAGEDRDEETGSKHLAAVVFHALTLMEFMETHPEYDDRYRLEK